MKNHSRNLVEKLVPETSHLPFFPSNESFVKTFISKLNYFTNENASLIRLEHKESAVTVSVKRYG